MWEHRIGASEWITEFTPNIVISMNKSSLDEFLFVRLFLFLTVEEDMGVENIDTA